MNYIYHRKIEGGTIIMERGDKMQAIMDMVKQLTEEQSRQIEKATKREIVKLKIYCLRGGILFCFLILNIIHHHHR